MVAIIWSSAHSDACVTIAREPVGVPGDPVGHVAAERAAHRGGAAGVDVRALQRGVGDRHQVGVGRVAPVAPAALDEVEAVAGGQGRVGQQHRVAVRHRDPRVPAPRPGVPASRSGPPWIQSSSGAGASAAASSGSASQARSGGAVLGGRGDLVAADRVRGAASAGPGSGSTWPAGDETRTGAGGLSMALRSA